MLKCFLLIFFNSSNAPRIEHLIIYNHMSTNQRKSKQLITVKPHFSEPGQFKIF